MQFLLVIVIIFGLLFLAGNGKHDDTPVGKTSQALDHWVGDCDPQDLHYGQTDDGQGQRAFIVTCGGRDGERR